MPRSPRPSHPDAALAEPSARAAVVGVLLVLLGAAGVLVLHAAVRAGGVVARVDLPVLDGVGAAREPWLTGVMVAVSAGTRPAVVLVLTLVGCAAWGLRSRAWWRPALLAGAVVLGNILVAVVKAVVARPRPPLDAMVAPGSVTSASFPSGHTASAAVLLLTLGYLARTRDRRGRTLAAGVLPVAGVALVGGSRLYLGHHYLTDVLAGAALAVAVLGVVVLAGRRAPHHHRDHAHDPADVEASVPSRSS